MTTSKDVARLANVSRSTVSRVLSGAVPVSNEIRKRVLEAVEKTGYEPDMVAQSLVKQQSRTIALAFFNNEQGFSLSNFRQSRLYFYLDVLARIENASATAGYDLILPSRPYTHFADYVRNLKTRRVAGVLMVAPFPPDERVQVLIKSNIPTVFIDAIGQGTHATYVKSDNIGGTRQAVEHLLALGHRRIAILTGYMTSLAGTERLLGAQQALAHAGVALDAQLIRQSGFLREEAYQATTALLEERLDFTALVAASDVMAFSAIRAMHERGIRVPEDVSVVGFDDIDFCLDVHPPLTTVRPDRDVMGQGAVRQLLEIINGAVDVSPLTALTELVVRASTGPVPATSYHLL